MAEFMVCPHNKIPSRTFRISGALIVTYMRKGCTQTEHMYANPKHRMSEDVMCLWIRILLFAVLLIWICNTESCGRVR